VKEFEQRLESDIERGAIIIPEDEDETKESVIRGKIREIVQEIEYGISSGIFEFTILNKNEDESLKQLREAAAYCFK
jgi:pSer/pThr/pTyr-binding forkhead associated (FHA) protein